jgi:hypothetical protein
MNEPVEIVRRLIYPFRALFTSSTEHQDRTEVVETLTMAKESFLATGRTPITFFQPSLHFSRQACEALITLLVIHPVLLRHSSLLPA